MSLAKSSNLKPVVVITRPEKDAQKLAKYIAAKNFEPFVEPMLTVKPIIKSKTEVRRLIAKRPQAILITSKHALKTLAAMSDDRSIPLITVGDATAVYAGMLGFKNVTPAGGTAELMASSITLPPSDGPLLYVRGKNIALDITALLVQKGYEVHSVIVYEAKPAKTFSKNYCKMLLTGRISTVVFFSLRTAATYQKLMEQHAFTKQHRAISAITLSHKIAENLKKPQWKKIVVAARPTQESLIEKLAEI